MEDRDSLHDFETRRTDIPPLARSLAAIACGRWVVFTSVACVASGNFREADGFAVWLWGLSACYCLNSGMVGIVNEVK